MCWLSAATSSSDGSARLTTFVNLGSSVAEQGFDEFDFEATRSRIAAEEFAAEQPTVAAEITTVTVQDSHSSLVSS